MKEHDIQSMIRAALSPHGKFFRAQVGEAWTGDGAVRTEGGGIYIPKARRFSTGLPIGFSDLFGAVPTTITPGMLGQTVAIMAVIEVKASVGRATNEQKNFLEVMAAAGCRAGVARSVDEAVSIAIGTRSLF